MIVVLIVVWVDGLMFGLGFVVLWLVWWCFAAVDLLLGWFGCGFAVFGVLLVGGCL